MLDRPLFDSARRAVRTCTLRPHTRPPAVRGTGHLCYLIGLTPDGERVLLGSAAASEADAEAARLAGVEGIVEVVVERARP